MGDILEQIFNWATSIIHTLGYPGVALLVALETFFPPIPSEVKLPLSGSLVASGRFNFFMVLAAATAGDLIGASALYAIGRKVDEKRLGEWLDRHGKWLLLSRKDLERSQEWFDSHGGWAVLIARLVPGGRSLVSLPAGLTNMPLWHFLLFTFIASALWNTVLLLAGYFLGQNWQQIEQLLAPVAPIIYGLVALGAIFLIWKRIRARLQRDKAGEEAGGATAGD